MMHSISIDTDRCIGKGLCVKACPLRVFEPNGDGKPSVRPSAQARCIACGHCVAVCPQAAITLDEAASDGFAACRIPEIPLDDLELLFKSRRSMRHFPPRAIPGDVLARAMSCAHYAPTAHNRRKVKWLELSTPELVRQLASDTADWMRTRDQFKHMARAFDKGLDPIMRSAPSAVFAYAPEDYFWSAVECSAAITYLELALHGMGMATCWAGFALQALADSEAIRASIGVPEGNCVPAGLMLGYPGMRYARIPDRGPLPMTRMENPMEDR